MKSFWGTSWSPLTRLTIKKVDIVVVQYSSVFDRVALMGHFLFWVKPQNVNNNAVMKITQSIEKNEVGNRFYAIAHKYKPQDKLLSISVYGSLDPSKKNYGRDVTG